jgi:hypothetical protein
MCQGFLRSGRVPEEGEVKNQRTRKHTEQTITFKQRMKMGQEIANQLAPVMTAKQVAAELKISHQAVRKIECLALAKIQLALLELAQKETPLLPKKSVVSTTYNRYTLG